MSNYKDNPTTTTNRQSNNKTRQKQQQPPMPKQQYQPQEGARKKRQRKNRNKKNLVTASDVLMVERYTNNYLKAERAVPIPRVLPTKVTPKVIKSTVELDITANTPGLIIVRPGLENTLTTVLNNPAPASQLLLQGYVIYDSFQFKQNQAYSTAPRILAQQTEPTYSLDSNANFSVLTQESIQIPQTEIFFDDAWVAAPGAVIDISASPASIEDTTFTFALVDQSTHTTVASINQLIVAGSSVGPIALNIPAGTINKPLLSIQTNSECICKSGQFTYRFSGISSTPLNIVQNFNIIDLINSGSFQSQIQEADSISYTAMAALLKSTTPQIAEGGSIYAAQCPAGYQHQLATNPTSCRSQIAAINRRHVEKENMKNGAWFSYIPDFLQQLDFESAQVDQILCRTFRNRRPFFVATFQAPSLSNSTMDIDMSLAFELISNDPSVDNVMSPTNLGFFNEMFYGYLSNADTYAHNPNHLKKIVQWTKGLIEDNPEIVKAAKLTFKAGEALAPLLLSFI